MRAGETFPAATLIGIDVDPLATVLARANLAVMGLAGRSRIVLGDYRTPSEPFSKPTLYIGNPPYVRHHQIAAKWKGWLSEQAEKYGHKASQLAGLHVHFFLATAINASPGDFGAFITASEWLDVNYGILVRSLLLGELGGQSITVIEPTAQAFPDAATTAAITTFEIGSKPASVFFRRVDSLQNLDTLNKGRKVHRDRLGAESRWSYRIATAAILYGLRRRRAVAGGWFVAANALLMFLSCRRIFLNGQGAPMRAASQNSNRAKWSG